MSLLVWLPLLGNLENQGTSNLQFTQSDTAITIDNNGKIGQCYTRATAKSAGRIQSDNTILLNGDLSMCCWAKVTATVGNTANGLISNHSASSNAGFGITVKQISTDDYRISCSTGNGSGRTYMTYYGTTNIKNAWHHLTLTYNSTTHVFQLWVDGIVEKTQSYTNSAIAGKIFLFDWNLNGTNNNYKPACSLNDVRIYNHCLSPAEVHEISQGLVLHYKLDSFQGMRGNANLLKSIPKSYNSSAYLAYQLNFTENLVANQTYTLQLWDVNVAHSAKSAANLGIAFYWGGGSVQLVYPKGTSYFTNGHADYIKVSFTPTEANASHAHAANLWFNVYNSPSSASGTRSMSIGKWKLEKGSSATPWQDSNDILDIIQDSSGYGHNGSILNAPTISSDTGKYSSSLNLNGTTDGILIENLPLSNIINTEVTYSFWIKPNGENGARSIYFGSYSSTSWSIEKTTGNVLRSYWNGSPDETCSGATITDGIWQHVCITKKGTSDIKVYINGVQKWNSTTTHNNLTFPTTFRIGRDTRSSDGTPYKGLMSDFRIYCTALSAADTKQLYEMGAKVDNRQNLHIYEAIEMQPTIKLTKQGQMKAVEFQEDTATKLYKTNQIIETNNLIEF